MKEAKNPPDPPPFTLTYVFPTPATPQAAIDGPTQAEALRAGEIAVTVLTDGRPHELIIAHNFNLGPVEMERRLPDVSFEAEDVDFYHQKPVIEKRGANSVTISLNPDHSAFGTAKPTKFLIKLKRYYTPLPAVIPTA